MVKRFVRTEGNYDADGLSTETGLRCLDASRTIQSQKDEADINVIVKNFGITGKMPENVRVPRFGDFEMVGDYRDAIHAVREAEASFMAMPANVRSEFENDPQLFLEFCGDPANLPRMRELGLAVPLPTPPDPPAPSA